MKLKRKEEVSNTINYRNHLKKIEIDYWCQSIIHFTTCTKTYCAWHGKNLLRIMLVETVQGS